MVIQPSADLSMDLFVDADFAGLWASEKPDDMMSVKESNRIYHYDWWHPNCVVI